MQVQVLSPAPPPTLRFPGAAPAADPALTPVLHQSASHQAALLAIIWDVLPRRRVSAKALAGCLGITEDAAEQCLCDIGACMI